MFFAHSILIHTPKCGGTYVNRQYSLHRRIRVTNLGHVRRPLNSEIGRAQLVGMIRDPFDWYCSYHSFMRKSLSEEIQTKSNFPKSHPIAFFSKNGEREVNEMLRRMLETGKDVETSFGPAVIYAHEISGVFDFMARTGFGFWTWTMLYHFSEIGPNAISNTDGVYVEARRIASEVKFVHQESIDEDVGRYLGLRARAGARVNVSQLTSVTDVEGQSLARRLDGPVADILFSR